MLLREQQWNGGLGAGCRSRTRDLLITKYKPHYKFQRLTRGRHPILVKKLMKVGRRFFYRRFGARWMAAVNQRTETEGFVQALGLTLKFAFRKIL